MVARGLVWKHGDRVITTILEHHSNLLPWRNLASQGVGLDSIGINDDYSLDLNALERAITPSTRLVTVSTCIKCSRSGYTRFRDRKNLP